ncbi:MULTISPECIES: hypothetical protein [unclassified Microcoleus]|uniref:hypothetical protein n=1 Tax=unclassified Microcoleus TaxID=2642155 RepID=UPI002FD5D5DF
MSIYKVYGRDRATETGSRSPDRKKFPIKLSQDRGLRIRKQYNGGYFDSSAIIKNLKAAGIEACI